MVILKTENIVDDNKRNELLNAYNMFKRTNDMSNELNDLIQQQQNKSVDDEQSELLKAYEDFQKQQYQQQQQSLDKTIEDEQSELLKAYEDFQRQQQEREQQQLQQDSEQPNLPNQNIKLSMEQSDTEIIDEQSELLKAYENFQRQQQEREQQKQQQQQQQENPENNLMDINQLLNFNNLESRIS